MSVNNEGIVVDVWHISVTVLWAEYVECVNILVRFLLCFFIYCCCEYHPPTTLSISLSLFVLYVLVSGITVMTVCPAISPTSVSQLDAMLTISAINHNFDQQVVRICSSTVMELTCGCAS